MTPTVVNGGANVDVLDSSPLSSALDLDAEFVPETMSLNTKVLGKRVAETVEDEEPSSKRIRLYNPTSQNEVTSSNASEKSSLSSNDVSQWSIEDDLVQKFLAMSAQYFPPGYTSIKSAKKLKKPDDTEEADPRAMPVSFPEVFSYFRQALCEALPYYQSYKSSLYSVKGEVRGILLDQECDLRDYLGSQVIVSTCGGGRETDPNTKQSVRTKSHAKTNRLVRDMIEAMDSQNPIAVVLGQDHPLYACRPPQAYCVLDFFVVTDVWAEKFYSAAHGKVIVYKYRLEKVKKDTPSWWAPPALSDFDGLVWQEFEHSFPSCDIYECPECEVDSKEIFSAGWTCLNDECSEHFKFISPNVDMNALQYSNQFLAERRRTADVPCPPLRPALPDMNPDHHGTEAIYRKGFVCPNCGLCNSRTHWNRLACEHPPNGELRGCGIFSLVTPMRPYPAQVLEKENNDFRRRNKYQPLADNTITFSLTLPKQHLVLNQQVIKLGAYYARQFLLPNGTGQIIGSVTLFPASKNTNSQLNGPNEMWNHVSTANLDLQRKAVAVKNHKLQGLTRHYTHNFGAPYKFGVAVDSSGFEDAPDYILKALHRLDWAAKEAVASTADFLETVTNTTDAGEDSPPTDALPYNELMVIGYMSADKIGYHDDGEEQLGPTVSTLSLGSPAKMLFRPKVKAKFPEDLVPMAAGGKHKDVLAIPVEHGDMVVMHGAAIHRNYEHAVEPFGGRRFAMTCRHMDTAAMTDAREIEATLTKGAIPPASLQWAYDGN